jgi:hypothetical protein
MWQVSQPTHDAQRYPHASPELSPGPDYPTLDQPTLSEQTFGGPLPGLRA